MEIHQVQSHSVWSHGKYDFGPSFSEVPRVEEFGDHGGLLVLVDDEQATDRIWYSWNDGNTWEQYVFYDSKVRVTELTIEPSSTSLKFLLLAQETRSTTSSLFHSITSALSSLFGGLSLSKDLVIQIDFSNLFGRKCDSASDFEAWSPGVTGSSNCVLGHETTYYRRKSSSLCYIGEDYNNVRVNIRTCPCAENDFECDVGYWRDASNKCVSIGRHPDEPVGCLPGTKYMGSSGYRKISSTTCLGGLNMEQPVEKTCVGSTVGTTPIATLPSSGSGAVFRFPGTLDSTDHYINSTTLIARDMRGTIWRSTNSGVGWEQVAMPGSLSISKIVHNEYFTERSYFLASGTTHLMTRDKGLTFEVFRTPLEPSSIASPVLEFHAEEKDWIIFVGDRDCNGHGLNCHTASYWTKDGGATWNPMKTYVKDCEWGRDQLFKNSARSLVLCSGYADMSGNMLWRRDPMHLFRSDDFFASETILFDKIIGFAISESFMVVADVTDGGNDMHLFISKDGTDFHRAVFPPNVAITTSGYTVLESGTGTLFVDVYTSDMAGREWGTLFISNRDGIDYTMSLENTNRDTAGYVDFEKLEGIEGTSIVNVVTNPKEVRLGSAKKIQTKISYNDGGSWSLLQGPRIDLQGNSIACDNLQKCSLHLHSFTERLLIKNEVSDSGATGLLVGIGNVGDSLDMYDRANVYITRDAGYTWQQVASGPHLFEFADHGGIIVLAGSSEPIDRILYSLDQGLSFRDYNLGTEKIIAERIVTEPDSTSLRMIVFGRDMKTKNTVSVALDFQSQFKRLCLNDTQDATKSDFELWEMKNQRDGECTLGHKVKYYRRKAESECFIGDSFALPPQSVANCACTAQDYECATGFIRNEANVCVAMPGVRREWNECRNGYSELSSSYRKIAMSTCEGGVRLETSQRRGCGVNSTGAIVAMVLIPCLIVLSLLGYLVYRRVFAVKYIRLTDSEEPWFPMTSTSPIVSWFCRVGDTVSEWWSRLVPSRSTRAWYTALRPGAGPEGVSVHSDVLMDDY